MEVRFRPAVMKIGGFWGCRGVTRWNIPGEESCTGVVNALLPREGLLLPQVSASSLSQICTDIIYISRSYLFAVNLDESLNVIIAF